MESGEVRVVARKEVSASQETSGVRRRAAHRGLARKACSLCQVRQTTAHGASDPFAAVPQHAREQRASGVRYRSQPDRSRSVNLTVPVVQLSEPLLARKPIVTVAFAVLRVVK